MRHVSRTWVIGGGGTGTDDGSAMLMAWFEIVLCRGVRHGVVEKKDVALGIDREIAEQL
jgi:hypothetical protein